jgi:hypothetical protein
MVVVEAVVPFFTWEYVQIEFQLAPSDSVRTNVEAEPSEQEMLFTPVPPVEYAYAMEPPVGRVMDEIRPVIFPVIP